ncbi:MAG: FAD-binding domain-containing protein, partial [Vibrio sp.]
LDWPSNDALFQAWCLGQTGYPIVDAAMRQLQQTGWMHNRLRMIVASFATKHLLIDWRRGEHFFIHHLIDGDLCANNGGWQWSAGSGCDAQPYFRIFNPITQSQKFDPQGVFIRKFVPELSQVPDKEIHFPHAYLEQNSHINYVKPIVEHKTARSQALDFYQATKNKSDLE